jgi:hypothetical protein
MSTNFSNLGTNPQFSILDFARNNSPRGSVLSSKAIWTTTGSAALVLQPPTNTSNGEMFFVKEVNLLIKKGTSLGNNSFQIYHNALLPPIMFEADSVIELFTYFDVDSSSPIQNPQFPTDATQQWDKLILEFPTPIKVRSADAHRFEIRYADSVNNAVTAGITAGEIQITILGWRILEATY